ncbi:glycosyltransferase [Thalassobacillus sp. C254]|uniref:glycosyltransferase n=1 Tax=Thalassobacillus sp. C254 TaxID=1225341 RepID=UPI0035B54AB7
MSAGRLVEKKGHHIVMQAFDKIRKDYPHASLTVIGSGREEEYIKSLASQLNLGDSFKLIQHVSKDKVREYMSNADLFCAASLESSDGNVEGIPNTIKEAMAIGLPVISTTHAGIPEIITHEQDGILVPENNVEELEQALRDMIENRENWETYTSAARKVVEERFDQEAQLLEQAKYYDELLKGK